MNLTLEQLQHLANVVINTHIFTDEKDYNKPVVPMVNTNHNI